MICMFLYGLLVSFIYLFGPGCHSLFVNESCLFCFREHFQILMIRMLYVAYSAVGKGVLEQECNCSAQIY